MTALFLFMSIAALRVVALILIIDVVRVALQRLRRELRGQSDVMLDFYKIENENEQEKPLAQSVGEELMSERK